MAPRKEKTEKASTEQGAVMILDYLRKQNRPYSATDVSSNLHNKVSKIHTAKHLKDLHDRKEIEGRVSGKQVVYHALQAEISSTASADLSTLETQLQELRGQTSSLKTQEKALKTEFATLSNFRSLDEIMSAVTALETQKTGLEDHLATLKKVQVTPISKEERVKLDAALQTWRRHQVQRSKALNQLWRWVWDYYLATLGDAERLPAQEFWEDVLGCDGLVPAI